MRTPSIMLLLAAVGCGPTVIVDGFKLDQSQYQSDREQLLRRASFDLACAADKLDVKVIEVIGEPQQMKQVGISGCDQRATYVNLFTNVGWVLNTRNGQPAQASR